MSKLKLEKGGEIIMTSSIVVTQSYPTRLAEEVRRVLVEQLKAATQAQNWGEVARITDVYRMMVA